MRIHEQNKLLKAQLAVALEGIKDLQFYLNSSKFDVDHNVNKKDVLLRLQETKNAVHDLGFID